MKALHDQIYDLLKNGPLSDEVLQYELKAPRPSVRRARQKLVNDGLVVKVSGGKVGGLWGLSSAKVEETNDRPVVKQGKQAKGTAGRPAPTPPPASRPSGTFTF